ncbi:MAG: 3-isopropylmalate dehydratase [Candidatus Altiarchaeales archaeon ex4484_96]|nr:MAG: 3-isopropylmalate dehydratase [Candidatus Altiarchaeales archaeon ex4484_96]
MRMKGIAHVFGDDVNTDYIISGRYKFKTLDNRELASHVMEDLDPDFARRVKEGDFIVAGRNFGCGSSREQAPLAIKYAGISAVLAQSFARIFYRNAINVGLPVLECLDADKIKEGDALSVDLAQGIITDTTQNITLDVKPLPDVMLGILKAGGLANYFKKNKGF